MQETFSANGSCLCQSVKYRITGHIGIFQYCHCSRCRKFTGSAHASNVFVPPQHFSWTQGEDMVRRYEPKESKHFATGFCSRCGSSLPWLGKTKKVVVVPAGTIDGDLDLKPVQNIFWGSRANWYVCASELLQFDALPEKKASP